MLTTMKYILYCLSAAALLLATACTDLDLQPLSTAVPDVALSEDAAYEQFLARVYAGLAVTGQQGPAGAADISSLDEGFSQYIRTYWQLQELSTEEAIIAWNDEGVPDIHNHTWTAENQFMRAMYYRIFFQVSMANEFLRETTDDKLEARGISQDVRDQMPTFRAEVRFLRALSYWHGIDIFGDIPFYTEESSVGSDAPIQIDRSTIFNFLVDELADIESTMVAPGENLYGRADRAALWMLQAKLFLNAEVYTGTARYAEALEASQKVIDSRTYTLMDEYHHNFLADNHLSTEIIFAVPQDGLNTQSFGGTTYLVHAAIGGSMDPEAFGVNVGWGGLRTTSTFVDLFPDVDGNTDERAIFFTEGQTKSIETVTEFTEGFAVPKYQNVTSTGEIGSDLTFPDTDYPMFRLADAYLIYAESVLRGGGGSTATAVSLINELRERAYNNEAGNITEADLTLDFILDERARELYWEAHRRQDRIRFGQFAENGVWPWKGGVPEGQTTEPFRVLFPLPAQELLANENLRQNTGY